MVTSKGAGLRGRQALFLYVLLVVLPALCFGLLLWHELRINQSRLLAELPAEARDGANRLAKGVAERVSALLDDEWSRPFEEYDTRIYRYDGTRNIIDPSPLDVTPPREGILGYFSVDASDLNPLPVSPRGETDILPIDVFAGTGSADANPRTVFLEAIAQAVTVQAIQDRDLYSPREVLEDARMEGFGEARDHLLTTLVLNLSQGEETECREAVENHTSQLSEDTHHEVHISHFLPLKLVPSVMWADDPGWALVAIRIVAIDGFPLYPSFPTCIERIAAPVVLLQGFVLDNEWLLESLPQGESEKVLGPSLRLAGMDETFSEGSDVTVEEADLLEQLRVPFGSRSDSKSNALVRVVTDASQLRREFSVQNAWLASMAILLTISMTIGIQLLLGSIRKSRAEAERTRNFVASISHELRTPIAAVKLYGEMLRDGWVQNDDRRQEYLGRIVSESDRLDGLVDRVLMRRRLYEGVVDDPVPGDLNEHVTAQRADLEMVGGLTAKDLAFELEDSLPPVLLTPDGIHVILQNLVENARKYAPPIVGERGAPGEPILIQTRKDNRRGVVLEVLDRGPGIAEKDRRRVFEAFLRLGDEHTRKTKGTGLGLHLVALQTSALRGRVQALPRPGGGTIFQVCLRSA